MCYALPWNPAQHEERRRVSALETSASAPSSGALSRAGAWTNLSVVSAAHAVIHATVVLMPLVFPILHSRYHISYFEIGLLVSVPSFIGGMLQLVFGYLGRYLARKTMIGVGNLLVGATMFLTGTTTAYPGLMLWSILGRIGGAPQHPVGSALLTDSFGDKRHGFALAAHVAGGNLGTLVVPLVGAALIRRFDWQPTVMLFALPGLVAGAAVLLFAREPAEVVSRAPAPSGANRLATLFAPLRGRGALLVIAASIIAAGGRGVGVLTTYLPLYLRSDLGLPVDEVAVLFTLLLVGSVAGPLVAGRLSDSAGRRPVLLVSYVTAALFTAMLPLVAGRSLPQWALVAVIGLIGLTAYAESPLLQAYLADQAPEGFKDAAFAWYFTLAFGVGSLWGGVLGYVADHGGFAAVFWIMAGSYILAGLVLLGVPRAPRRAAGDA
jgi:FSR family fosmidomycin resistance protein-like MFS transporter